MAGMDETPCSGGRICQTGGGCWRAAAQPVGSTASQLHSILEEQQYGRAADKFSRQQYPDKEAAQITFWKQLQKSQTQLLQKTKLEARPGQLLQEMEKEIPRNLGLERKLDRLKQEGCLNMQEAKHRK